MLVTLTQNGAGGADNRRQITRQVGIHAGKLTDRAGGQGYAQMNKSPANPADLWLGLPQAMLQNTMSYMAAGRAVWYRAVWCRERHLLCCNRSSTPFTSICKLSLRSVPGATASMMGVVASTGEGTGEATSRAPTVSTTGSKS